MSYTEQQAADYLTAKSQRAFRYAKEADPMMAKVLAEEIEKSVWLAKKNEIKQSLPYPEGVVGSEIEQYCTDNELL
jgi:predicted DsbA family dithiol-disulfide isomerase|tara:strand:+ start:353 stop:580 length:228 start_codon:yes stop_codon:yes gene_type:complete